MVWLREVVRGGETTAARRAASDFAKARRTSGWSCAGRAGRQAILPGRAARSDGAARDAQGGKRFCRGAPRERMEPRGMPKADSRTAGKTSLGSARRKAPVGDVLRAPESEPARRASGWSCTERAGRQAILPGRAARADGAARGAQGGKRFCQGAPHERMEPHGTRRAASDFAKARRTSGWSCAGRAGRQAILPGRAARSDGAARDAQGGKRFCRGAPRERMEPRGMPKADSRTAGKTSLGSARRKAPVGDVLRAPESEPARRASGWSCTERAGRQAILPGRAARADGAARDAQGGFAHSRQNFTWKRTAQGARRGRPPCTGERTGAPRAGVAGSRGTGAFGVQACVRGVERDRRARGTGRAFAGSKRRRRARGAASCEVSLPFAPRHARARRRSASPVSASADAPIAAHTAGSGRELSPDCGTLPSMTRAEMSMLTTMAPSASKASRR